MPDTHAARKAVYHRTLGDNDDVRVLAGRRASSVSMCCYP
jgi:hypothetical protein